MKRRTVLTRTVGLTALGLGLAGCSSDDSSDNESANENGSDTDDADGSETGQGDGSGGTTDYQSQLRSDVEGLDIVGGEYTDTGIEGRFPVTISVENTGSQETQLDEYNYDYAVADASGSDLTGGASSVVEDPTIGPGETGDVLLTATVDGEPGDVASYAVSITCGTFGEGIYCE